MVRIHRHHHPAEFKKSHQEGSYLLVDGSNPSQLKFPSFFSLLRRSRLVRIQSTGNRFALNKSPVPPAGGSNSSAGSGCFPHFVSGGPGNPLSTASGVGGLRP